MKSCPEIRNNVPAVASGPSGYGSGGLVPHQYRRVDEVWVVRCRDGVMSCADWEKSGAFWLQVWLLVQSLSRRRSRSACVCAYICAYIHVLRVCVYMCMYVYVQNMYICI